MKLPPLRLSFLVAAAAACWVPVQDSQAALLAYEPFDYTSVTGSDQNGDNKKDLMGLAGGFGWSGAWTEFTNYDFVASPTEPLDYVNSFDLAHPSGDPRFSNGGPGSLSTYAFTASGQPRQDASSLHHDLAEPILFSEGTTIWLSVLLRKDSELLDSSGHTRPNDSFEIGLVQADFDGLGNSIPIGLFMGDVGGTQPSEFSTSFGLKSVAANQSYAFLDGRGPRIGETNFLVVKLSIASGNSRMEFFLNPSLDNMSPVPDLSLALNSSAEVDKLYTALEIRMAPNRPTWTADEIRVGTTYADVIPEPSSLLLISLGVTMLAGARLRRSRVSLS